MKKPFATILILSIFISFKSKSQIFTGGNASVTYSNGLYIDLSPLVGYKLNKFNAGISPFFAYSQVYADFNKNYSWGGKIFGQYTVIEGMFVHLESKISNIYTSGSRSWIFGLPVGCGYERPLWNNARAQFSILYDVLLDKNSPAENPEIRGGIIYGF